MKTVYQGNVMPMSDTTSRRSENARQWVSVDVPGVDLHIIVS